MTTVSKTITITNTEYQTLASLANITLTNGNWYSIQIQNIINWKVADAELVFENRDFGWKQAGDDVYVRVLNPNQNAIITILENS